MIMLATVLQPKSSRLLMSRKLAACVVHREGHVSQGKESKGGEKSELLKKKKKKVEKRWGRGVRPQQQRTRMISKRRPISTCMNCLSHAEMLWTECSCLAASDVAGAGSSFSWCLQYSITFSNAYAVHNSLKVKVKTNNLNNK
jgi:hypothetical protein